MTSVSVVIPTFNRAYCLERALLSVLGQGSGLAEVIVVDDGSDDDTERVVGNISDDRIKYIKKTNGGVSSARNAGIDAASGELLAFLDSDDYWPENYLHRMTSALQKHPQCIVAYCMSAFDRGDGSLVDAFPVGRCKSGMVTEDLFRHHFVSPMASVIRAGSIGELRFDETLRNMEDPDFFLRLSLKGRFLFVDGMRVTRTDTPGSLSKASSDNALLVRERFYFELGGNDIIDSAVAFEKLARISLRLGKKHYRAGHYRQARSLFLKSVKYRPWALKPRLYLLMAGFRSLF